jgi:hypothetical protein
MDPVLLYLIEFNETNSIEYKGRYLIPPGGLLQMLGDYKKFRLNREEVIKPEIPLKPVEEVDTTEQTLEELYAVLD